jgi:hypothetical protein
MSILTVLDRSIDRRAQAGRRNHARIETDRANYDPAPQTLGQSVTGQFGCVSEARFAPVITHVGVGQGQGLVLGWAE